MVGLGGVGACRVGGVNKTRYGCEFTLDQQVICIGMVKVCLEGAYFIPKSLVEVQMKPSPPPAPACPLVRPRYEYIRVSPSSPPSAFFASPMCDIRTGAGGEAGQVVLRF